MLKAYCIMYDNVGIRKSKVRFYITYAHKCKSATKSFSERFKYGNIIEVFVEYKKR